MEFIHDPATCAHCAKAQRVLQEMPGLAELLGDPRVIVSQRAIELTPWHTPTLQEQQPLNGRDVQQ